MTGTIAAARRVVIAASVAAAVLPLANVAPTYAGVPARAGCTPRTLVLSAMPVELAPLLAQTTVTTTIELGNRHLYVGRLRGRNVVLALTGIGPVNATHTARQALARFTCAGGSRITAVVFSGVAGGDEIGNVIVPSRWTLDAGKHVLGVDRRMLAAARTVARAPLALQRTAPAGDPACGCVTNPDLVGTVSVTHQPRVEVGGTGQTTDPFSGRALACVPAGGDVLGCEPCVAQTNAGGNAERLGPSVLPFVDPAFFSGYAASSAASPGYVAEDEETAAVDAVATARHVPFIGIRAVSDGGGDPLQLPGFPVQFFYYRQLAADNAARMTMAFLSAWRT
jgi:nucleoside phosphorylase